MGIPPQDRIIQKNTIAMGMTTSSPGGAGASAGAERTAGIWDASVDAQEAQAPSSSVTRRNALRYVKFGNSDMVVSELCAGTMTWGSFNADESMAHEQMDALVKAESTTLTPPNCIPLRGTTERRRKSGWETTSPSKSPRETSREVTSTSPASATQQALVEVAMRTRSRSMSWSLASTPV